MWWNKQQKSQHGFSVHPEFFLGAQTIAAGSVEFESDILLDGRYTGEVTTSGLIEVGNNANVNADLEARVGIIEGKYKGKASFVDEVQIKNCASVDGNIESANILVEKGAQLNAKCKTI
ncbi:MAG: polymer-forming cytoskeletal protein [Candidatus Saccharibacteria bacterium]